MAEVSARLTMRWTASNAESFSGMTRLLASKSFRRTWLHFNAAH